MDSPPRDLPVRYRRRTPETTALHGAVLAHFQTLRADLAGSPPSALSVRLRLAFDADLTSAILSACIAALYAHQRTAARALGVAGPLPGAVTGIQRFSSALALNVHFHVLAPESAISDPAAVA
jgi:hypothetical protein